MFSNSFLIIFSWETLIPFSVYFIIVKYFQVSTSYFPLYAKFVALSKSYLIIQIGVR